MAPLDRRRFLQLAGATAATSALMGTIDKAAAIPANHRTGSLRDVEHVVILMQENRSFDHYFGSLRGVRGFGDPTPATLPNGKSVWHQPKLLGEVLPFHPSKEQLGLAFLEDLDHSWTGGHLAFNGGNYDRWVPAKTATTMAYLTRQDIPFHYALADAFTICDQYHCSLLGPTDPNRYYMWSGWVGNDGNGGGPVISNDEQGYSWTTYPERLEKAGVSWRIYQDVGTGLDSDGSWGWTSDPYIGNYGDNSLLYFDQYRTAAAGSALYEKARTGTDVSGGGGYFDQFRADVTSGKLPQVSWIVAPEAFTEHPNWPANYGAWYVSQILDALTADPQVWARTALFITYDENDGFFDHIVPPHPPVSPEHGGSTVSTTNERFPGSAERPAGPYGMGQRVPMLVVSPWSKGGFVCSDVLDHTSIIRFLERRFEVAEPNITPWRRSVAGDLLAAFDFSRGSTSVPALPSTSGYQPPDKDRHVDYVPVPPVDQSVPRQEPGTRPARPLGYRVETDDRATPGTLSVHLRNTAARGVALQIRSTTDPTGPWSYTVGAREDLRIALHPLTPFYAYEGTRPQRVLPGVAGRQRVRQPGGDNACVRAPAHGDRAQPGRRHHHHQRDRGAAHDHAHARRTSWQGMDLRGGRSSRPRLVRRDHHLECRSALPAAASRSPGGRPRECERPGPGLIDPISSAGGRPSRHCRVRSRSRSAAGSGSRSC